MGVLRVNLSPTQALGQWKFTWEFDYHDSGNLVRGLPRGEYELEFKSVGGYIEPPRQTISVQNGVTNEYAFAYQATTLPQVGSLTVHIHPPSVATNVSVPDRGQWKRQGEPDGVWHDSDEVLDSLPVGIYIISFKTIADWATPGSKLVNVKPNRVNAVDGYYYSTSPNPGDGPLRLDWLEVNQTYSDKLPYVFCGQIQSPAGFGSGCVVKNKVVLTAAHVVYDDVALSFVPTASVKWFLQRYAGLYEPPPQIPRGWCVFEGYASAREADRSPGVSSRESQNLDVAALYFLEPAGGGGYSGYVVSRSPGQEWLYRTSQQTLVGYPVEAVPDADRGRMHATRARPLIWSAEYAQLHSTTNIKAYAGNSGGPLCVQFTNQTYYPAAVFLGGAGRTVVRAIDEDVAGLIVCAEVLGDQAPNNTGGDPILLRPNQQFSPIIYGFVNVQMRPVAVTNLGAGYRFKEATNGQFYNESDLTFAMLGGTKYTLEFSTIPYYFAPGNIVVTVTNGLTNDSFAPYQAYGSLRADPLTPTLSPREISSLQLWAIGTRGSTYRIDYKDLQSTGSTAWRSNLIRLTLTNREQFVTNIVVTNVPPRVFRSVLKP